jgi:SAM-dependent methyltransferase
MTCGGWPGTGAPAGGVFDRAADSFDAVGPRFFGPAGEWLVEVAGPVPGSRVLDVGSGGGAVTIPAARAVGPSGRVDAVDSAPAMVRRLRAEARRLGLANIRSWHGDAHEPPARPAGYDIVTAGFVLFLLERPRAATVRYADLLAPGGRLVATTFGPPDPRWRWMLRLYLSARPGAGGPPGRSRGLTGGAVTDAFAAAGLRCVRSHERTIPLTFASADEWYAWSWSHGERAVWESMSPSRRAAAKEFAYDRINEMIERIGAAELAVTVRCTVGERPAGPETQASGGDDDRTGDGYPESGP